jgi:hypothetical protein
MQRKRSKLPGIVITTLVVIAVLYIGYCTGAWGKDNNLLQYLFQCSCPQTLENIRVRKVYSEHAEIMFSACDNIGPIPSPSGQEIAVINYAEPDRSYVWSLQTDEKIPFTWFDRGDLFWIADDILLVYWGKDVMNVVDVNTKAEYPIPARTGIRKSNGRIAPAVLSALRNARHVILTNRQVAVIRPDDLVSSERSFFIHYDEFGYTPYNFAGYEKMRQLLRNQRIRYLDLAEKRGTAVLSVNPSQRYQGFEWDDPHVDLVSPDGRFFYRESFRELPADGIYLAVTGEKIVEAIPGWDPVDWVYNGVILRPARDDYLADPLDGLGGGFPLGKMRFPWLRLRVPAEYNFSD